MDAIYLDADIIRGLGNRCGDARNNVDVLLGRASGTALVSGVFTWGEWLDAAGLMAKQNIGLTDDQLKLNGIAGKVEMAAALQALRDFLAEFEGHLEELGQKLVDGTKGFALAFGAPVTLLSPQTWSALQKLTTDLKNLQWGKHGGRGAGVNLSAPGLSLAGLAGLVGGRPPVSGSSATLKPGKSGQDQVGSGSQIEPGAAGQTGASAKLAPAVVLARKLVVDPSSIARTYSDSKVDRYADNPWDCTTFVGAFMIANGAKYLPGRGGGQYQSAGSVMGQPKLSLKGYQDVPAGEAQAGAVINVFSTGNNPHHMAVYLGTTPEGYPMIAESNVSSGKPPSNLPHILVIDANGKSTPWDGSSSDNPPVPSGPKPERPGTAVTSYFANGWKPATVTFYRYVGEQVR